MAYQFTQTGQELQYLIDRIYQIADEYDSSASYAVGDYCSYQGHIYRCTTATTGTFDASAWTDSVFVMDTIKALDTRLTTAEGDISSLNLSLAQLITTRSFTSEAFTVAASSSLTVSINVALSGYTPIGIATYSITSTGMLHVASFAFSGNTLNVLIGNNFSASRSGPITVTVLYRKS